MGRGSGASGLGIWVRSDWRRRWLSIAWLGLLTGVAFGVVATTLAGARRTESSFDRLRHEVRAYDEGVAIDAPGTFPDEPSRDAYDGATLTRIEQLPEVATHANVTVYVAALAGADGELGLFAPEDETLGRTHERGLVVRGRRPDVARPDEVAINEAAADRTGIDVGGELHLVTLSPEQWLQLSSGDVHAMDGGPLGPTLDLHVVGVIRGPMDVVGRPSPSILATPAFDRAYRGRVAYSSRLMFVWRAPHTTAAQVDAAIEGAIGSDRLGVFDAESEDLPARNTTRTSAVGLLVFALVAAVASLFTIGIAIGRHTASLEDDQAALLALGFTRRQRVWAIVTAMAPVAVVGTLLAIGLSFGGSAVMPVGLARRIEPHRGVQFDGLVALLIVVLVAAVVGVSATIAAVGLTRRRLQVSRATRPSGVAAALATGGAPPVVTTGAGLAFDRRPPALPVRSAVVGAGLAVLLIAGAVVFLASLDRLAGDHERWGYGWDLVLDSTPGGADQLAHEVAARPDVAGASVFSTNFTFADDRGVRAYGLAPVGGSLGYSLRSGTQPIGPDEVVVGPETARLERVHVGDTLSVVVCPCGGEGASTTVPVRVVGIALFPEDDDGNYDDALGFSGAGFARHVDSPSGVGVAIRIAPGADAADLVDVLEQQNPGQLSAHAFPSRPGNIQNLTTVRRFPIALAGFAAFLGVAALVNVLVTTAQRRRRHLATLRSLGLTTRQTSACVVWQAVSITVIALAFGLPLGILLGTAVWGSVSERVDVATDPVRPLLASGILTASALAVATIIGLTVGGRVAGVRLAGALRDE